MEELGKYKKRNIRYNWKRKEWCELREAKRLYIINVVVKKENILLLLFISVVCSQPNVIRFWVLHSQFSSSPCFLSREDMVSNSLSLLLPISFPSIFKPDSPSSSSSSSSSSIPTKFPFFSDSSRFPKSFRLFRCQIPASSSSASNQLRDDASPDPFFQNNSIADFMRFKRDGPSAELQTAIVSYKKKFPWSILQPFVQVSPPSSNSSNRCSYFLHGVSTLFQVDLVSTIHIADKEYAYSFYNLLFFLFVCS